MSDDRTALDEAWAEFGAALEDASPSDRVAYLNHYRPRIEAAFDATWHAPALATPRPAGVDVEWFVEEVVAYYKLYDHHDIWRESGARALGEWLNARAALTVSEEPARE